VVWIVGVSHIALGYVQDGEVTINRGDYRRRDGDRDTDRIDRKSKGRVRG
jgi:hypothetical protein